MEIIKSIKKTLALGAALATLAIPNLSYTQNAEAAYSVQNITQPGGAIEHRLFDDAQHFMSVIDDHGAYVVRPHPGLDVNGWGSSWYFQPFLPGAVLKNTSINSLIAGSDIEINASGLVSMGKSSTYGNWNSHMHFSYDASSRKVSGTGNYSITLENLLNNGTGDLNLYKIASNYLDDVPLLSGGIGDTGDMGKADVVEDVFSFSWIPENQPAHFPGDLTNFLSIDVNGMYNNVDTAAQGYAPIAAAYKPSLKVVLNETTGSPMIFGGIYDTSKSQQFWADNIGITPLILKNSTSTNFSFDVQFESETTEPLPEPGTLVLLCLGAFGVFHARK